jgi:hypothetical protein
MNAINRAECVAQACGCMNDAALPNVHAMAQAMADLVQMIRAIDANISHGVADDVRVSRAASMLDHVAPHLASSIGWNG